MATYFKLTFEGEPTDDDRERAAYLIMQGYLEGELINEEEEL